MSDTRKYKVVQLLEWFELGGGLESITGEIASGLDKSRFDVEIWCIARGGKLVDAFRKKGIEVKVLDIKSYFDPRNIFRLAKLLKESKVDVIHTHVYFAATIGRVAAKIAGIKVIVSHVHSTYWHYTFTNLMIERLLSKWTQRIICVSEAVRKFVIDHEKIDPRRVVVIPNGISKQKVCSREDSRKSLDIAAQETVLVCVASLLENKGHRILVDAIRFLKEKKVFFKCLIVGEGPMELQLKKLVQTWNLSENIRFLGVRDDVPQILSACDIFILPSINREGLPVSILEAMAYEVPVIASRVGGVEEIITHEDNGILVAPLNVNDLADAIETLINNPQERKRLTQAANRTFQEKFEIKFMVRAIESLYFESLRSQGVAG